MGLDIAHRVVTEVTHQAAVKTRQRVQLGHIELAVNALDRRQGIIGLLAVNLFALLLDQQRVTRYPDNRGTRQSDNGIAAPLLTALHRFQQITVRALRHLEVGTHRGFEIRQHLSVQRDPVVALAGEAIVFGLGNHR